MYVSRSEGAKRGKLREASASQQERLEPTTDLGVIG